MSTSKTPLRAVVDNWLTDIRRRGAGVYAINQTNGILYLSLQGKDGLRYSIQIDLDAQELRIEINRPDWKWVKREAFLLNVGSLRLLAKRICPLPQGQAVIPVYLLVRLSIVCHAYLRLLEDYDREHRINSSTDTVREIESELSQHLTPEEQQRTDNPFLRTSPRDAPILTTESLDRERV
jgi:hypothetical protein